MEVEWPEISADDKHDLLCVNVSRRVDLFDPNRASLEDMQQQTLHGAQWIPTYLLEILPYQPMTGQMISEHTTEMMKYALHLPAENAALTDKEVLGILGLKDKGVAINGECLVSSSSQSNFQC